MSTKNGVNPPAPNPAHNSNFSLLSVLGRERLTSPNYMDWMRNLRFTLRYENKKYVLNEQIPTIDDDSTQEEIEAYQKYYDDAHKVSRIMASSMSPELQKTFENTWAYEMNQQLKEILESLNMVFDVELSINIILSGIKKIDVPSTSAAPVLTVGHNAKKRKTSHSNQKGKAAKRKSNRRSKRKPKSEIAPTSDPKEAVCFYCNTKGHWKRSCLKYLKDLKDENVKKGSHSGQKKSRRLKHGELNLVMGNRKITPVTRIGKYELMLKSRNGDILVYSNGCFMFKASPCKGIYETVECISHNGNVILNVGSSNELDKSKLSHSRLGHINKKCIAQLQKDGVLESFDFKLDDVCESCLLDKMTKSPLTGSCESGERLLDLVHTDLCGPFRSSTKDGKRYYVTFTDDFSRYGYVYLIKHKSDTFEVFKRYQNEVENQLGRKIKLTPPRTPQLKRVTKRRNRTLLDMVRSMMSRATLPISLWGYTLDTTAHILNLVPTKKVSKTPFDMWKGNVLLLGTSKSRVIRFSLDEKLRTN
ncbi:retrotransposon protein, putative, ty1-copia subclass [Tanacetum coccineum]